MRHNKAANRQEKGSNEGGGRISSLAAMSKFELRSIIDVSNDTAATRTEMEESASMMSKISGGGPPLLNVLGRRVGSVAKKISQ